MTKIMNREPVWQREIRRARDQFEASITNHEMHVLMDQATKIGPYRHIRFAEPGTSIWSFSLVTWPGHLAITGDLQDHVFCRVHDMFNFFRGPVNASYWAEKIVAEGPRTDHGKARYSDERFIEEVHRHVEWARDELTPADFERLRDAAQAELLDEPPEHIEHAHEQLAGFTWEPTDSGSGYQRGFEFSDTWEWDLGGYDHHYLIAIHAIQWGVNRYLKVHPDRLILDRR